MFNRLRKYIINKRIEWAIHDRAFFKRQMAGAFDEIQRAEKREHLLRIKLTEVDHPLPRILRNRGLT